MNPVIVYIEGVEGREVNKWFIPFSSLSLFLYSVSLSLTRVDISHLKRERDGYLFISSLHLPPDLPPPFTVRIRTILFDELIASVIISIERGGG